MTQVKPQMAGIQAIHDLLGLRTVPGPGQGHRLQHQDLMVVGINHEAPRHGLGEGGVITMLESGIGQDEQRQQTAGFRANRDQGQAFCSWSIASLEGGPGPGHQGPELPRTTDQGCLGRAAQAG